MSVSVEITDNSADVLRILQGATIKAAEMVGENVESAAKRLCSPKGPKGKDMAGGTELRENIAHQVDEDAGGPVLMVGSNMQIAPYIELGTGKEYDPPPEWIQYHGDDEHSVGGLDEWFYWGVDDNGKKVLKKGLPIPAQPYLRPAFLDHVEDIKAIIQGELEHAEE